MLPDYIEHSQHPAAFSRENQTKTCPEPDAQVHMHAHFAVNLSMFREK